MAIAAPLIPLLLSAATSIVGGVMAKQNADADAKTQRRIGAVEAEDKRRETRRLLAAQEAQYAANKVVTDIGSPLDVAGDTVAEGELAALRLKFARDSMSDAIQRRGDEALLSSIFEATGTLLGGGLDIAGLGSTGSRRNTSPISLINFGDIRKPDFTINTAFSGNPFG